MRDGPGNAARDVDLEFYAFLHSSDLAMATGLNGSLPLYDFVVNLFRSSDGIVAYIPSTNGQSAKKYSLPASVTLMTSSSTHTVWRLGMPHTQESTI